MGHVRKALAYEDAPLADEVDDLLERNLVVLCRSSPFSRRQAAISCSLSASAGSSREMAWYLRSLAANQ